MHPTDFADCKLNNRFWMLLFVIKTKHFGIKHLSALKLMNTYHLNIVLTCINSQWPTPDYFFILYCCNELNTPSSYTEITLIFCIKPCIQCHVSTLSYCVTISTLQCIGQALSLAMFYLYMCVCYSSHQWQCRKPECIPAPRSGLHDAPPLAAGYGWLWSCDQTWQVMSQPPPLCDEKTFIFFCCTSAAGRSWGYIYWIMKLFESYFSKDLFLVKSDTKSLSSLFKINEIISESLLSVCTSLKSQ